MWAVHSEEACCSPEEREQASYGGDHMQSADLTIVDVGGDITEYPHHRPFQGDPYVGGFLSGLVQQESVTYCCSAGAHAASVIVQQSGCTLTRTRPTSCPEGLTEKVSKLHLPALGAALTADDEYVSQYIGVQAQQFVEWLETLGDSWVS